VAPHGEHQSLVIGGDLIRLVRFSPYFRQLQESLMRASD
jgi:hypothetical protein